MQESKLGNLQWLRGLQRYLEFANDKQAAINIGLILKLLYANKPMLTVNNSGDMKEFLYGIQYVIKNDMIDTLYRYYFSDVISDEDRDINQILDTFSLGQVESKIWLAKSLVKIKKDFNRIYLLAGWFGQLVRYLDVANVNYNNVRVFDIDPIACKISDSIFNRASYKDYKVKSAEVNINSNYLNADGLVEVSLKSYSDNNIVIEQSIPDCVINTSTEHFRSDWYNRWVSAKLSTDPLFIIQSNNMFDLPGHINCVNDLHELKEKFPMSRLEFAGELEISNYKRFMLIGRP